MMAFDLKSCKAYHWVACCCSRCGGAASAAFWHVGRLSCKSLPAIFRYCAAYQGISIYCTLNAHRCMLLAP